MVEWWIKKLGDKLKAVREVISAKDGIAKERMKKYYDKKAVLRNFDEGSLVLLRTPDLRGKLEDQWDGPFEIAWKVEEVTNEIVVPGRRTGKRRVHINMLKQWKQPEADIFRVVVAEEDAEEVIEPTRLADPDLTEEQNRHLDDILGRFMDVVCTKTGKVDKTENGIETGESPPIRSVPYRIAPAWKQQIHEELELLLEQSIISHSGLLQLCQCGSQMASYAYVLTSGNSTM